MAFFDKVSEIAKSTTEKANDKIEITRINGKIRTEQQTLDGCKAQLGARYWDLIAAGSLEADPSVADLIEKIKASLSTIEDLEGEIARIKEEEARRQAEAEAAKAAAAPVVAVPVAAAPVAAAPVAGPACANCGAALNPGARFCQECGTPVPVAPVAPARRFCANCGTELGSETRFCPECGAKA